MRGWDRSIACESAFVLVGGEGGLGGACCSLEFLNWLWLAS